MSCIRKPGPVLCAVLLLAGNARASSPSDRLAEWKILTSADGASLPAERYAAFLRDGPVWPLSQRISWRYQHSLAQMTDPAALARLCPALPLTQVPAFLTCRSSLPAPLDQARRLWIEETTRLEDEQSLLAFYAERFTAQDQWRRYERLEQRGLTDAARRQIDRLAPDRQPLARARLAALRADPQGDAYFSALTAHDRIDPTLIRFRLTSLRRLDRLDEALALWKTTGLALQSRLPSADWTRERLKLAYALLRTGQAQDAALLAEDATLPKGSPLRSQAEFLSGFIALHALHDPLRASPHFRASAQSPVLFLQARGLYWDGRAQDAAGRHAASLTAYRQAARLPTSFYGQAALAALTGTAFLNGQSLTPAFQNALMQALSALPPLLPGAVKRTDLLQAATQLSQEGDARRATLFLVMLQTQAQSAGEQKAVADLATALNLPKAAILAERALAAQGHALFPEGFPQPYPDDPSLPEGLLPAVIRQESHADPYAQSPARAIGLMQLLPDVARDIGQKAGLSRAAITPLSLQDPDLNLKIGALYLQRLLTQFDGVLPFALAGYNAGPRRVRHWLEQDAPPQSSTEALLDWIEQIPFPETRLYIERVEADMILYRLRSSFR